MDDLPRPKVDPDPPDAPGGVDAIHEQPDDFLATPDPPISAQMNGSRFPDEVKQAEDHDEEKVDPRDPPAEPSA